MIDLQKAMELQAKMGVLIGKIDSLSAEKQWEKCIPVCTEFLTLAAPIPDAFGPTKANVHMTRGEAHREMGSHDLALADFDAALEFNPDDAAIYNGRGRAYAENGDFDRAITDFKKALNLDPKSEIVYNNLGCAYRDKGEVDLALENYAKALETQPDYPIVYVNRANAYSADSDFDRAIADLDRALELDPKLFPAYLNRAFVHGKKGIFDRAIADYTKALEIQPGELAVYNARANAYAKIGEYSRAIADCNEVLKKDPKNGPALFGKSIATRLQQLAAEAQKEDRKHDQKQVEKQKEETGAEIKHQASQFLRRGEYNERYKEFQGETREASQKIRSIFIVLKAATMVFSAIFLLVAVHAVWVSDDLNIPLFIAAATLFVAPFLGELLYQQRKESSLMALAQDAHTKSMLTDMVSDKELLLKLFDHISQHNSAQLIAKSDPDSAKLVAQLLGTLGG